MRGRRTWGDEDREKRRVNHTWEDRKKEGNHTLYGSVNGNFSNVFATIKKNTLGFIRIYFEAIDVEMFFVCACLLSLSCQFIRVVYKIAMEFL